MHLILFPVNNSGQNPGPCPNHGVVWVVPLPPTLRCSSESSESRSGQEIGYNIGINSAEGTHQKRRASPLHLKERFKHRMIKFFLKWSGDVVAGRELVDGHVPT